jgi:Domain of unknown function (DUF4639)
MNDHETLSEAFEVARITIEEILDEGAEALYLIYIAQKSIPFGIKCSIESVISILELNYIRHEPVEANSWIENSEPVPCSIDTWARNAIPTQKKFIMPQPQFNLSQPDAKSVKSHKSLRSSRTAIGRRVPKPGKTNKGGETIEEAPQPFPMIQTKPPMTEREEILRIKKENEFKKKSEENERIKKLKEELEENEKKLRKETAEMRNKQFTYDYHKNIMFVNPLKYDLIPKMFSEVEFKTLDKVLEPTNTVTFHNKKNLEDVNRLKTAPVRDQEWVRNITSVQPSLFDSIKVNEGVVFVDGNRSKYPNTVHSASHKTLTTKEYKILANPSLKLLPNNFQSDRKLLSATGHESYRKGSGLSPKRDILEEIPDYDSLVDGSEESNQNVVQVPNEVNQGKVTLYGPGNQPALETPVGKFNAEILKNKNWGANPGLKKPTVPNRLPKRPSSKGMREIYGDMVKKPKDQPFITTKELWDLQGKKLKKPRERPFLEKVEKKTRMPPPRYGLTMINALPDYEEFQIPKSINK